MNRIANPSEQKNYLQHKSKNNKKKEKVYTLWKARKISM